MNFSWIYRVPSKSWWSNYRWHIIKPSKELGLKGSWKNSFFRVGWQSKVLEIDSIDRARECLRGLQDGTITAFGGRFRGASYDKNVELIIKQARRSLKEVIKKHDNRVVIDVKETATVPPSYYNWGVIISISGVVIIIIVTVLWLLIFKKKREKN